MKYLVVLTLALVAFAAADEEWKPIHEKEVLKQIHNDCLKESGATDEQIEKIKDLEFPDEKQVKDFIHCAVTKMGFFTDDKGYDLDRMMAQFSVWFAQPEKVRSNLVGCIDSNEEKSTPAEWAFRGHQCIMRSELGLTAKESKRHA